MRRWGVLVSVTYAAVLVGLLLPMLGWLIKDLESPIFANSWAWFLVGTLCGAQSMLLLVSVDTTWRKARPRQHVAVTAAGVGIATALLLLAGVTSFAAGMHGDSDTLLDWVFDSGGRAIAVLLTLWAIWAAIFYLYARRKPARLDRALTWLLRGSVLELLIAVPSHVVARRRDDCSAPAVTGFGLITGIAVMLMCFGPGVYSLYARRLQRYRRNELHARSVDAT